MAKVAQRYLTVDPWRIIENGFHAERNQVSESIFSLGNEYMGLRGSMEEGFSGPTMQGAYFNGVFEENEIPYAVRYRGFPTRNHFMVNSLDWLHTRIRLDGQQLDLATAEVEDFRRILDLREGTLTRSFIWTTAKGKRIRLMFQRFVSMTEPHLAAQRITAEAINFTGSLSVELGLDFDTVHVEHGRNLWPDVVGREENDTLAILGRTERSGHRVLSTMQLRCNEPVQPTTLERPKYIGSRLRLKLTRQKPVSLDRIVVNLAEKDSAAPDKTVWKAGLDLARKHKRTTYDAALASHTEYWRNVWDHLDVSIDGDPANEQGVRFCIFQLHQTYHGVDPSLNVSAKGLTGEMYSGHAWWDTETYCLPFYLFNNLAAARNLVEYRYNTLEQAKDRARQLDCLGARYPMCTIDGTESNCVWQHGDLEIHVSAAVGYAVWHYVNVTGDVNFLHDKGAEMLIEICRFYASRGAWSAETGEFGFWCVMGADEFHMMVHNNYYTNAMARKCFEYALRVLADMRRSAPTKLDALLRTTGLDPREPRQWRKMASRMRLPQDPETGVYEQHDGYFDMPHLDCAKIPVTDFPLYGNWAYYRLFRWDMIKQPDVLLMHFFFSHDFSLENKRANYEYYEPRCSHESSLSPGVHSILAAELGKHKQAYDYWGHAARLDLDDYNRNAHLGLHTTSMAAAWMNVVYGFGGMRSDGKVLSFTPSLPRKWKGFSFRILYRDSVLQVRIDREQAVFATVEGPAVPIEVFGKRCRATRRGLAVEMPADRKG